MKFSLPDRKNPNKKLYFLRTLKTEKDFKDRYDVEFNAQLGTILSIMMNLNFMQRGCFKINMNIPMMAWKRLS